MSDQDIAALLAGVKVQLEATTVSYPTFVQNVKRGKYTPKDGSGTMWGQALAGIDTAISALSAVTPPPTPPPATGNRQGNGYLCNLQGNSYAQEDPTDHAHYGGTIVGTGDYAAAAAFAKAHGLHAYGYKTSVESLWAGAIDAATARANGWNLKTSSGVEITNGAGLLMCDIGNPDYQKAWCDYTRKELAAAGLSGLFLDNVTGTMGSGGWWFHEGLPAKYTSDAAWQAAYVSMLKAQQTQLPGVYRLANAWAPDRLGWWKTISPYVDGIMFEYYDGSDYANQCVQAAQAAGKDAWALVDPSHNQPGPDSPEGIALTKKFAAVWDRKGGGFGFNGVGMWRDGAGSWTAALA